MYTKSVSLIIFFETDFKVIIFIWSDFIDLNNQFVILRKS